MEIAGIALRDVIIGVSGLAAIYVAILLLRLVQVGRRRSSAREEEMVAPGFDPEAADDPPAPPHQPDAAPLAAPSFGDKLVRSHQDMDARQLREEVGRLRSELAEMREEVGRLKATRHISPQYSDAMTMAQRGLTSQDVADRCGISLGEADLICALSRGPMNFDEEEDYGGESRPQHARAA